VREYIGRHNAVDKVTGRALFDGLLPAADHLLVASGRVSFEIVQKAVAAGVAGIVAVSAPSSLAVDLAREDDLLLAGMARRGRLNLYAGEQYVRAAHRPAASWYADGRVSVEDRPVPARQP
jgi:FdhD protein